jgi:hypothetical protein
MRKLLIFLLLLCFPKIVFNQPCNILLKKCIIENGESLLNRAYKSGTLDKNTEEKLTYYCDKFDCVTFIEYLLALSLFQNQIRNPKSNFEEILTKIRYQDGIIAGYGSRLHYFTSWIIQNKQNGYIDDITQRAGGIPWQKKINYMSSHVHLYPKLNNTKEYEKILTAENTISTSTFYYIPKTNLIKLQNHVEDGDIIAITTNKKGLDIIHTGIVIIIKGKVHLMHASSDDKKVVITKEHLEKYLGRHRNQTGIMILRPTCPA